MVGGGQRKALRDTRLGRVVSVGGFWSPVRRRKSPGARLGPEALGESPREYRVLDRAPLMSVLSKPNAALSTAE
jgi:hypothetical protein